MWSFPRPRDSSWISVPYHRTLCMAFSQRPPPRRHRHPRTGPHSTLLPPVIIVPFGRNPVPSVTTRIVHLAPAGVTTVLPRPEPFKTRRLVMATILDGLTVGEETSDKYPARDENDQYRVQWTTTCS